MGDLLKQTCADHGLTGIGVNVFGAPNRPYIGVYVHWQSGDDRDCASGNGESFEEALSRALAEMAERRDRRAA